MEVRAVHGGVKKDSLTEIHLFSGCGCTMHDMQHKAISLRNIPFPNHCAMQE